jgi:hypothetical protein
LCLRVQLLAPGPLDADHFGIAAAQMAREGVLGSAGLRPSLDPSRTLGIISPIPSQAPNLYDLGVATETMASGRGPPQEASIRAIPVRADLREGVEPLLGDPGIGGHTMEVAAPSRVGSAVTCLGVGDRAARVVDVSGRCLAGLVGPHPA